MLRTCLLILTSYLFVFTGQAHAVSYVNFDEHFTTNFGDPEKPKLSYLRVNIALKVDDDNIATTVRGHRPFLRDLIIRHLVRQQPDTVRMAETKAQLLEAILTDIQAFLSEEEGEPLVHEVMFTEFIVQE